MYRDPTQLPDSSAADRPGRTTTGDRGIFAHVTPDRIVAAVRNHRIAFLVASGAAVIFALLAFFVATSEATLLQFDRTMQRGLLELRTGWLDRTMIWLTFLGTRYVIGLSAVGLLIWSQVTKRHRVFVLVIVVAALLNPVFEIAFKELLGRVRPAVDQLLPGNGPSFPSGHVLAAVGFYGLMPLLAWEATRKRWARAAVFFGSVAVVAVVALSRPYLDVHWTTDAVAGVLLGTVLVMASYHVYLRLRGIGVPAG